jgi:epidermal growth factor receptor substrate 15
LQNKLKSTQQSLKSSQEERKTLESTIAAQASQLSSLQSQLSTASAAYETEKKLLETLQERMNSQNQTIQKTREELIRKESELSALKLEKSEVEGNLLRDKEDVRQLEREMKEANEGCELIKTEIEKAKKEARQQKGRLAIAKKQLATSQSEREKAYQELETAKLELEQAHKEIESTQAQIETINAEAEKVKSDHTSLRATSPPPAEVAARVHIPDTPDVHYPSAASVKSTNPFEKLAMSSSSSKPTSPFQPFTTPLPGIMPGTLPETSEKITPHPGTEAVTAEDDDPFGFNEPVEEAAPAKPQEEEIAAQPTFEAMKLEDEEPKLEENDSKAPNTVAGSPPIADQFPPLEDIAPTSPTKTEGTDHLDAAKEIEPVESDSSDDEDDVPLGTLKATQTEQAGVQQPKLPPGLSNGSVATPGEPATVSAFDDIFAPATADSMEADLSKANAPVEPSTDVFESTFGDISPAPAPALPAQKEEAMPSITAPVASGIDAFDEAMGKLTPTPAPAQSTFGFESNFGDTFDFGTSSIAPKETPKPAPEAPTSVDAFGMPVKTNGDPSIPSLPPITTNSQPFSFDDAFGATVPKAATQSNGVEPKAVNGEASFEDVFGADESQAPKSPTSPTAAAKQPEDTQISPSRNNSSIGHGPSSPRTLERPASPLSPDRTMSSTRSTSPPPRRPLSPSARKGSGSKAAQGEDKRSHKLSVSHGTRREPSVSP